jgi:hypothetical protein
MGWSKEELLNLFIVEVDLSTLNTATILLWCCCSLLPSVAIVTYIVLVHYRSVKLSAHLKFVLKHCCPKENGYEYKNMFKCSQDHPEISAFLNKIANSGRKPIFGEYDAIMEWVTFNNASMLKIKKENEEAFRNVTSGKLGQKS